MTRPLNFRQIEAFHAVMQSGTTTAAAAQLHTTQPSVSRLIAQVQGATGLKLFDNHKGRLRPTREAQVLFDTVRLHFLGLDRIERSVAALRKSGAGTLRLACTPALALSLMPMAVHAFSQEYPDVHINLQTVGTHALREGLVHGQYDLGLTTSTLDHDHIETEVLHRAQVVCVMHPRHPLAGRKDLHVRDMRGQLLLTLNADDEIQLPFVRTLQEFGVEPAGTVETTYSGTICRMAAQGTGIGVVNPYVASVFAHELRILPLQPRFGVSVSMAFAPEAAPSAMADRFAGVLRERLRDYADVRKMA
ncbi:MAG TPA: LysR substrate-binding domain-containing protein [Ramlibacter sp.]